MQKPDGETKTIVTEENRNPQNRTPKWPWRGEQQLVDNRTMASAARNLNLKGNTIVSEPSKHRQIALCKKKKKKIHPAFIKFHA